MRKSEIVIYSVGGFNLFIAMLASYRVSYVANANLVANAVPILLGCWVYYAILGLVVLLLFGLLCRNNSDDYDIADDYLMFHLYSAIWMPIIAVGVVGGLGLIISIVMVAFS